MPAQPAAVQDVGDELARIYAQAWSTIQDQQERLILDPTAARKRARLKEIQQSIEAELDSLDEATFNWVKDRYPLTYAYGATTGAAQGGETFSTWTTIHQQAVQQLAQDTFNDLLKATRYARRDTKRFIRDAAKAASETKVATGQTAVEAGRDLMRTLVRDHGITGVVYKNGAHVGLDTYSQMVIRTKTALAYNEGTLNGATEAGIRFFEVFDGPDCGWSFHDDPDLANGKIVTAEEFRSFPISHPNCRRAPGGRPDVTSKKEAQRAQRSTTPSQDADIRAADAQRAGQLQRLGIDVNDMSRKDMLSELERLGYTGPTSYTKDKLGSILERQRSLTGEPPTPAPTPEPTSAPSPTAHRDVSTMSRKEILDELSGLGYSGPTSYTKSRLGEILNGERPSILEDLARRMPRTPRKDPLSQLTDAFATRGANPVGLTVRDELHGSLKTLIEKFPRANLEQVKFYFEGNAYGEYKPQLDGVFLDPRGFGSTQQLRSVAESNHAIGYWSDASTTHAFVHEFGHVLDFRSFAGQPRPSVLMGGATPQLELWDRIRAYIETKVLSPTPAGLDDFAFVQRYHHLFAEEISEYASTNHYEVVAEAFAEYMLAPNPRPIARIVGEYFEEHFG